MTSPSARPTYRTLDEIIAETESILDETIKSLERVSQETNMSLRDRLTAHALMRTRYNTVLALRKHRKSTMGGADRRFQQFASVFEVTEEAEPIDEAGDLDEAERRMCASDAALLKALEMTTTGDSAKNEEALALVSVIEQMRRECSRVMTTSLSL